MAELCQLRVGTRRRDPPARISRAAQVPVHGVHRARVVPVDPRDPVVFPEPFSGPVTDTDQPVEPGLLIAVEVAELAVVADVQFPDADIQVRDDGLQFLRLAAAQVVQDRIRSGWFGRTGACPVTCWHWGIPPSRAGLATDTASRVHAAR